MTNDSQQTPGVCKMAPPAPQEDAAEPQAAALTLSRDAILSADDIAVQAVPVPEWGGALLIKAWSGKERDAFEGFCMARRKGDTIDTRTLRAQAVIRSAVDANGQALFTKADVDALQSKSAAALARVFEAVQDLNHLTDEDVEDLAGNSDSDQNDGFGSD